MKRGERVLNKTKCFEHFINEKIDSIYRFAYTYMRSREDAEDVVNESVVKALKGIGGLKDEEAIKCWFYRIVANTAVSELRKRGRMIGGDDLFDDVGREDDYSKLNFESMIASLSEDTKAVVVLKCCDNMSFREISEVLAINENTVKTRFYTAVKKLKEDTEL